jgi:hypothetical protein
MERGREKLYKLAHELIMTDTNFNRLNDDKLVIIEDLLRKTPQSEEFYDDATKLISSWTYTNGSYQQFQLRIRHLTDFHWLWSATYNHIYTIYVEMMPRIQHLRNIHRKSEEIINYFDNVERLCRKIIDVRSPKYPMMLLTAMERVRDHVCKNFADDPDKPVRNLDLSAFELSEDFAQ